jgi:probable HAF family extracellular repeat protein
VRKPILAAISLTVQRAVSCLLVWVAFHFCPSASAATFTGLGDLPGGAFSSEAFAISADGKVVVGRSAVFFGQEEAFRWTASGGMVGLGNLPGGASTTAYAASADGSTVVGRSGWQSTAIVWTEATGMIPTYGTVAFAVSGNGSAIAGNIDSKLPAHE